ncbi:MAG: YncE family protein, partial [Thermoplasmata archaeon]|nr:YncE family protein [Thermoplasmata archaeon]
AERGEVYVANADSNSVAIISETTDAVLTTVPVGSTPEALTYDRGLGEVWVANAGSRSLSVISDTLNGVTATLTVGSDPLALAWDPGQELVVVSNHLQGTLSFASPGPTTYTFTVRVSGLPPQHPWSLNVTGKVSVPSTSTVASVDLVNGSFAYVVATADSTYYALHGIGQLSIDGASASELIGFNETSYDLAFLESGLPSGTNWSIVFNGFRENSLTSAMGFTLVPNGSFGFVVDPIGSYVPSPGSGTIVVHGAVARPVSIEFHLVLTGLAAVPWWAWLGLGLGAALAVIAVLWVRRRRRPREGEDWFAAGPL